MAFKTYGTGKSNTSNESKVDYDKLNEYVVETTQLQRRETLVGYVAGIVDLGIQEQEDSEFVFEGDEDDEQAEIDKDPEVYFKDGVDEKNQPVRLKCKPQVARQAVAVAIDLPDIIVDKGQFFDKSNPQPLRIWMGGQFYNGKKMVVGRPTHLNITKKDGHWSFSQNHLFYKMAVDSKLIDPGEAFLPQDVDQLLGKTFQFSAQVYFKENKGKKYYTEYIKYQGALSRGQKEVEPETPPFLLQFDEPDEEALKNLRSHIINTIQAAKNYEGSPMQEYFEGKQGKTTPEKEETPTPAPAKKTGVAAKSTKKPVKVDEDDDDSIPF